MEEDEKGEEKKPNTNKHQTAFEESSTRICLIYFGSVGKIHRMEITHVNDW